MFEEKLYAYRLYLAGLLLAVALISAVVPWSGWSNAFFKLLGHGLFGQAIFSYVSNKNMILMGAIERNAPIGFRRAAAAAALVGFILIGFVGF